MISAERPHLYVTSTTHAGRLGKNNEDRYAVAAYQLSEGDPIPSLLAIIADGIGGHRAGEVAAELAVESILRMVSESDGNRPQDILQQALTETSVLIRGQAEADPLRKGMGATCVCAWVIGDRLYATHAGDSRLYLIRHGNIRQLTIDHTWVQEAIENGILTPEQAHRHPNAHIIRRYLGSRAPLEPDFRLRLHPDENDAQSYANQGFHLLPADCLLLCSDGLTDLVSQEEILGILLEDSGPPSDNQSTTHQLALSQLVDLANARGGHDNITIISLQNPSKPGKLMPRISPHFLKWNFRRSRRISPRSRINRQA